MHTLSNFVDKPAVRPSTLAWDDNRIYSGRPAQGREQISEEIVRFYIT